MAFASALLPRERERRDTSIAERSTAEAPNSGSDRHVRVAQPLGTRGSRRYHPRRGAGAPIVWLDSALGGCVSERSYRLSDRYTAERGTVFLTGTQALAR